MSIGRITRRDRRAVKSRVRSWPEVMKELPRYLWPVSCLSMVNPPHRVFLSREFIAQIYNDHPHVRLSISRAAVDEDGDYPDGITWDELQRVKSQCGFGDRWAVECYPPESDVVNVANLRHIWILCEKPTFGWSR